MPAASGSFRNLCTGCHTPSYVLQFRFDEDGWNKIIDMMKVVPNSGVYPGQSQAERDHRLPPESSSRPISPAPAVRARARSRSRRGRGRRARPPARCGRSTTCPLVPEAGIGTKYQTNDGTDWSLGTTSKIGLITHDGGMDFDGNLWFTSNNPNRLATVGRVDAKTGEVKLLKVARNDGLAANAHGLARDQHGQFLVRRQSRPPQPRQARSQDREDRPST